MWWCTLECHGVHTEQNSQAVTHNQDIMKVWVATRPLAFAIQLALSIPVYVAIYVTIYVKIIKDNSQTAR